MLKVMLTCLTALVLLAQPAAAKEYVEGTHYEVLPTPVKTRDSAKIEVVELFWYGCRHCFNFEPVVKAWKANLAADVDFHPVPAMWHKTMILHAQAFFAADALGVLDKIHEPFFNMLNVQKKKLDSEEELADFFATQGVDKNDFTKAFNSFGVNSQLALAQSRAASYRIQGTPEMVVNGKYRISSNMTGGQGAMLEVADFLIEKERASLKK